MKDELSFPAFTHDSIAGYCNGNPLYAHAKKALETIGKHKE